MVASKFAKMVKISKIQSSPQALIQIFTVASKFAKIEECRTQKKKIINNGKKIEKSVMLT